MAADKIGQSINKKHASRQIKTNLNENSENEDQILDRCTKIGAGETTASAAVKDLYPPQV